MFQVFQKKEEQPATGNVIRFYFAVSPWQPQRWGAKCSPAQCSAAGRHKGLCPSCHRRESWTEIEKETNESNEEKEGKENAAKTEGA
jgi:hypothetical protein